MKQKICTRCVSDTTMEEIRFDEAGVCNFCKMHDRFVEMHPLSNNESKKLEVLIKKIKKDGKKKEYDCIIGLSGGVDSTYLLYWAVKNGLRPLAVSFDNGWNTEIAINNIKKATNKLKVDLHTIIADWEEMKDIQRAFLFASVSDADAPSDYAIYSILYKEAVKAKVHYSLNGHSFRAEGTVPKSWSYFDGRYVKSVHKKFGQRKRIKSFPLMSLIQFIYYVLFKKIRDIRVFDYIPYNKERAKKIISQELDWQDYGGHHHENIFTRWFQSYYLPKKFNIDKRKVEFSAQVRSGYRSREDALNELQEEYTYDLDDFEFVKKKLELTDIIFDNIMRAQLKTYHDYPSYENYITKLKYPLKIAASLNLIPKILYEKYAKD